MQADNYAWCNRCIDKCSSRFSVPLLQVSHFSLWQKGNYDKQKDTPCYSWWTFIKTRIMALWNI